LDTVYIRWFSAAQPQRDHAASPCAGSRGGFGLLAAVCYLLWLSSVFKCSRTDRVESSL